MQLYGRFTEPLAGNDKPVPPVTVQLPPLLVASVMLAVIASQSLGLATVIMPFTCQLLSVKPVSFTFTV